MHTTNHHYPCRHSLRHANCAHCLRCDRGHRRGAAADCSLRARGGHQGSQEGHLHGRGDLRGDLRERGWVDGGLR